MGDIMKCIIYQCNECRKVLSNMQVDPPVAQLHVHIKGNVVVAWPDHTGIKFNTSPCWEKAYVCSGEEHLCMACLFKRCREITGRIPEFPKYKDTVGGLMI